MSAKRAARSDNGLIRSPDDIREYTLRLINVGCIEALRVYCTEGNVGTFEFSVLTFCTAAVPGLELTVFQRTTVKIACNR